MYYYVSTTVELYRKLNFLKENINKRRFFQEPQARLGTFASDNNE